MNEILAVFIGGGAGSLLRYGISRWFPAPAGGFPLATFIANMCACLLLGMLWGYLSKKPDLPIAYSLLLLTGFCGGFSTFSTFGLETMTLVQQGQWSLVALYVMCSVGLGSLLVFLGVWLTGA